MRIISFFSFKGGVGRTALLTNLGAHWAARGRVVALMDLDLIAPGISYSPQLGGYLDQRAIGLGMSDLLAAYHDRDPKEDTFKFLPPSLLLREMELPEGAAPGGRLLAISAGSEAGGKAYAERAPALASSIIRAIPRATDRNPDDADDAANAESPESLEFHASRVLRGLATHIREDLAAWRAPPDASRDGLADDTHPDAADPAAHPDANRPIDYLLIDARTGFAELAELSLGYLADHMVLVSGLNNQNIQGLRLTLRALWEQQRVPLDEMPSLVTVVFSPVPAGEDDAVLKGLENGQQALSENLRYTRAGQLELMPRTFEIHYTPLLALSDAPILPARADSLYGKEVRAIADHLAGEAIHGERFQEELNEIGRKALGIVEEFGKRPPIAAAPDPRDRPNPFTDLPAWHWPLGEEPDARTRTRRMKKLVGKLPHGIRANPDALLNRLAWDIFFDLAKKRQMLASLARLGRNQWDELLRAMEAQRGRALSLWKTQEHRQPLMGMLVKTQREWALLILGDESGRALWEHPLPNAEAWPEYWLALASDIYTKNGQDQAVLAAVDQAIGRAGSEEKPELAEGLMQLIPIEADAPALLAELEARARHIAQEHPWLDFLVARRLLKGPQKDPAAAEKLLKPLLATPPEDAPKCSNLGALVAQELPEIAAEAEIPLRKSIQLDPKDAVPWNNLGILLKDQGRPEEAETALRKSIQLDPKYALPWHNLGNLLTDQGRPEEAEAAYRKAMELDPKFAVPWNNLGILLKDQGRPEEAETAYRRAMELDPKVALPWNNLGNLLKDQGRPEEAETAYRKAMELDPKDALPWNNLGNLLTDQGRPEEAETAFRKAMELDPKDAVPWNGLGLLQRDWRRDCAGALESFRAGLELAGDDKKIQAYLHENLGHTLHLMGRPARTELEAALVLFEERKERNPDNNANALRLALELEDTERTTKYLAICREFAAAGHGGSASLIAAAEWLGANHSGGDDSGVGSPPQPTDSTSEANLVQRITNEPKNWGQYWNTIDTLYFLCGIRREARAAGQAVVKALLALPATVTDQYPDKPRPDHWRARYLPFANGESDGAGDPRDRHLFCREGDTEEAFVVE